MLTLRDPEHPESGCVTLKLSSGHTIYYDLEDYDRISEYRWYIRVSRGVNYAFRKKTSQGKTFLIFMHRQIMHCPNDMVVHHINHNGLDNRKSNLILVTPDQHRDIHRFHWQTIWLKVIYSKYTKIEVPKPMTLIRTGSGVTDIRGGMAGNVFSRDKTGLHCNSQARYIKRSSPLTTKRRNGYRQCVNYWNNTISTHDRRLWLNYAHRHPKRNKIGMKITLTAFSSFLSLNIYRTFNEVSILATPPLDWPTCNSNNSEIEPKSKGTTQG